MKRLILCLIFLSTILLIGCGKERGAQEKKDALLNDRQQSQYAIGQPVPSFDWSFERHLMIQLYHLRNKKVATHAVWRSDYGMIEGDCPSMGYGLPYDTSLTNPLKEIRTCYSGNCGRSIVEQSEPNGIFASKNTSATWVMCVGISGAIEPIYIESKVTIYPGPVKVDYTKNRVSRSGKATVHISKE